VRTLAEERDRAQLLARLRAVRPDSARRWGRMSVHQMVCHLADNYRMALGQRPVETTRVPVPRGLVKWAALYAPLPWPRGIPTAPETDQERLGTRPLEFAVDLAEAAALLERVAAEAGLERRAHTVFGAMTAADWLRWAWLHTDHHLRQFGA
jgi:hypothetical protein